MPVLPLLRPREAIRVDPSSLLCFLSLLWTPICLGAQQFPTLRAAYQTVLEGDWRASTIVAVRDVVNARSYGERTVPGLPWPRPSKPHKEYWCVGDFQVTAVVKGDLPTTPKKYLWATVFPGCHLFPDDPHAWDNRDKTRAWFLREEGEFLRPALDYGGHRFLGVLPGWNDGPPLPAGQRLGVLLLTPVANTDTLKEYARYLGDVVDIAHELLGRVECIRRLRSLARLGNPALRDAACGYLKGQLSEDCHVPHRHGFEIRPPS
jgi:hypothetical protein